MDTRNEHIEVRLKVNLKVETMPTVDAHYDLVEVA